MIMTNEASDATVEQLWDCLAEFFAMVKDPYKPIAQKFETDIKRFIVTSQQIAGISPSSEDAHCEQDPLMAEHDPARAVIFFERLAARFKEHGVAAPDDLFQTGLRFVAFVAEMWRMETYDADEWFIIWDGLWDGIDDEVTATTEAPWRC